MVDAKMNGGFQPMQRLIDQAIDIAPRAAMVFVILLVGIVLAALARRFARWSLRRSGIETLAERLGASNLFYAIGYRRSLSHLIGQVVWIAGILFTLAAVAELLGLRAVAAATAAAVAYLPRILAAAAILITGQILGTLLRNLIYKVSRKKDKIESPKLVGTIAYYAVIVISSTLALQQTGLETELINALIKIALGIVGLSLGLSFALASRGALQDIIARHYCEHVVRPGDTLRSDHADGTLIGFTPVFAVVKTARGERMIPCRELLDGGFEIGHQGVTRGLSGEREGEDEEPAL